MYKRIVSCNVYFRSKEYNFLILMLTVSSILHHAFFIHEASFLYNELALNSDC